MISEQCDHITGIDVSPKAIEYAKEVHAAPNAEYLLVEGGNLPFKDNEFDLVTSFQVIEHVDGVMPYLREIRRVLRPSGSALFTTPNRCIRLEVGQKPWNPFHVREYEATELKSVLAGVFQMLRLKAFLLHPIFIG